VYLAHKLLEEVGVAALMTLPFSCVLYFPMQLHGTWALFWMVYFMTSTIGIGELPRRRCCCILVQLSFLLSMVRTMTEGNM
jgi:hypothetical protein